MIAGSKEFIARARKNRKMVGGGMRQTGILAAAGILALTDMTKRLTDDHDNAKLLARLISDIPGVTVDMESVQINMVFASFDWENLTDLKPWLIERGIIIGDPTGNVVRFVTHYSIEKEDVETLAALLKEFRG